MEGVADSRILIPSRTKSRRAQNTIERVIKAFFGGSALVAVIVLALITIFLFREGFGFFGQNLANLRLYRRAGLEYVDVIRDQAQQQAALSRQLGEIRQLEARSAPGENLDSFDKFASDFSDSGEFLNALVSDSNDQAGALREALIAGGAAVAVSSAEGESSTPGIAMDPALSL